MGNIVLLDEHTINKIAAGEVIERPASVIKEMVENSIDAGATNITVEIKNGGISYIRVVDNGKGISQDDLELAFERHATSKIRSAEDLSTVKSMGFRGEALASIAAVSNVELISKTISQDTGYKVVVEGGNVLHKEEVGCQNGTIITVKNLFFNTPVRYKFLKKDYTESGYIEDVITRIALVHPKIAFKLVNAGKTIIQTTGNGDLKSVVYSIYGKTIAEASVEANYTYEDITVTGIVGKPEIARSNRTNQIFFVNKRYIRDKNISAAVTEAFKGMIPLGKFGFVILNLEMDLNKVDVNVHPAKLEVRFEEEGKVFKAIYHTIKDTLLKEDLVANKSKEKQREDVFNRLNSKKIDLQLEEEQEEYTGLFGWRKNKKSDKNKKEEENNIISEIYNEHKKENNEDITKVEKQESLSKDNKLEAKADENNVIGEPVDTFDILEKLKEIQKNLKQGTEADLDKINNIIEQTKDSKLDINSEQVLNNNLIQENKNIKEKINVDKVNVNKKEENNKSHHIVLEESVENAKKEIDKLLNNVNSTEITLDFEEMYKKTFGTNLKEKNNIKEVKENNTSVLDDLISNNNISIFEEIEEHKKPTYKFVGIAFRTYIIIQIENELYFIDQHAAHERILYEKVKENYYSDEVKNSQLLLLPDIITLTHKEMDIAMDNKKMFEKAGFILEEFGENTIKLSGVPDICLDLDTKSLFLETLDEINTIARTAKQEIEERLLATIACKSAVKANMDLSNEEVRGLIEDLLNLPNPFSCPHGRPTVIKMTKYDIERKFFRK